MRSGDRIKVAATAKRYTSGIYMALRRFFCTAMFSHSVKSRTCNYAAVSFFFTQPGLNMWVCYKYAHSTLHRHCQIFCASDKIPHTSRRRHDTFDCVPARFYAIVARYRPCASPQNNGCYAEEFVHCLLNRNPAARAFITHHVKCAHIV